MIHLLRTARRLLLEAACHLERAGTGRYVARECRDTALRIESELDRINHGPITAKKTEAH